jgi:RimJ/RimL family protein N-acetyltransferase
VWAKNERAQAFCQRFGFREIGWPELHLGQDVQTALTLRKGMAGR